MPITDPVKSEVDAANLSGKQPVAFIHGLWLLPNSWDAWRSHFEDLGYSTLAPGWPDDPDNIEQALANPDVFAGKSINDICTHLAEVLKGLNRTPIIIGHSFGGLLTMKLAGLGYATASGAISPAPHRGVLPLPIAALKSSGHRVEEPSQQGQGDPPHRRPVLLRVRERTVAGGEGALRQVLGAGRRQGLLEAAFSNINPATEATVVKDHPDRGPMPDHLRRQRSHGAVGDRDAAYKRQGRRTATRPRL